MLTTDDLKTALPPHLKNTATQDLADKVNNIATDPEFARSIRENFISYTSILREGRFKVEDYLNAVAYVSYKMMGYTNQESYKRTFPNRYAALVAQGADDKTISSYVAAFNKGKLVNLVLEQTLVPMWVLNQDVYQKAISTQYELMVGANSEKVRCEAANSILTHLKRPEKVVVELPLGEAETSGMRELREAMTLLAQQQRALISAGVNTRTIAHQRLVEALPGSSGSGEMIEATAKDVTPVSNGGDTSDAGGYPVV